MIPAVGIAAPRVLSLLQGRFAMMNIASELSMLLCACTAALPLSMLCAVARAQEKADPGVQAPEGQAPEVKALLARIDAARGRPAADATLRVEGTSAVTFAGATEPVAKGRVREIYAGALRVRQTTEMGAYGAMERGCTEAIAW
jgi:hypothetical protein